MESRARALLLLLPLMTAAAAAVLFIERGAAQRRAARAEDFARLFGGPVANGTTPDSTDYHPWYATSESLSSSQPGVPANAPHTSREGGDAFRP